MVCPIRTLEGALALIAAAAAGANLSLSAFLVPRLLESPPDVMLRQWRRAYASGKAAFVGAAALVSLAQIGVYLVRYKAAAGGGGGGGGGGGRRQPSRLPLLAAGLVAAVVPYTLTAMLQTNRALLARSAKAEAEAEAEAEVGVEVGVEVEVGAGTGTGTGTDDVVYTAQEIASSRYLVDHWGLLNLGRSALWTAAATVGLAAVL